MRPGYETGLDLPQARSAHRRHDETKGREGLLVHTVPQLSIRGDDPGGTRRRRETSQRPTQATRGESNPETGRALLRDIGGELEEGGENKIRMKSEDVFSPERARSGDERSESQRKGRS